MKRIVLLRHGQSQWNLENRFTGWTDVDLTEQGMEEARSGARVVKAMVPLSEMFGYVTALRTITSGRATSSMEYDHHSPVSNSLAKEILEELNGNADLLK